MARAAANRFLAGIDGGGRKVTRHELVQLVEQAYATYNQALPAAEEKVKTIYTAWYELLHDLEYKDAKRALVQLAVKAQFMPRPGEIRRATINNRNNMTSFDDPLVAWGKFLSLIRDINSGVQPTERPTEALTQTIKLLGDAATGMHTNADREAFCRTYEKVVEKIDGDRYDVPESE